MTNVLGDRFRLEADIGEIPKDGYVVRRVHDISNWKKMTAVILDHRPNEADLLARAYPGQQVLRSGILKTAQGSYYWLVLSDDLDQSERSRKNLPEEPIA